MRSLIKNTKAIIALNYRGKESVTDSDGNYTGEVIVRYFPAKVIRVSISGARGSSQSEVFGSDVQYDKTLCLSMSSFKKYGFDENTVFFIDKKLEYKDGTPLYNYRVERIAEVLNDVVIAVKKVRSDVN